MQTFSRETIMTKQIDAVYENGVLRPLEPLELEEQQRVRITIENGDPLADLIDTEFEAWCARESKDAPSIEKAREILSKARGSLSDIIIAERDER
jgi:predicted DNA-binding antitoxin AbrB/MazE fold protein